MAAPDNRLFHRWFRVLVQNQMAGPALSVAGLGLSGGLIEFTRVAPVPHDEHVEFLGVRLMDVSVSVFVVLMIEFGFLAAIHRKKKDLRPMTIVYCDYRPNRARKAKPAVELPVGRNSSAPNHHASDTMAEIIEGVPDDAERTRRSTAFIERTLKTPPSEALARLTGPFGTVSDPKSQHTAIRPPSWPA